MSETLTVISAVVFGLGYVRALTVNHRLRARLRAQRAELLPPEWLR